MEEGRGRKRGRKRGREEGREGEHIGAAYEHKRNIGLIYIVWA